MDGLRTEHEPRGARQRIGTLHRDQRGAVTTYVLRLILVFAVLIFVVEEVGQVVSAQIHASNAAGSAAQAGADNWAAFKNSNKAEAAAVEALQENDPHAVMLYFGIGKDGTVTVTVSETAHTLLTQHLPYVKKYVVQHATESEIHSLASTK
jgi:Flp pilus assembly protein TadG